MKGTISLGRYSGIPVRLHWSFLLLIGFVVYLGKNLDAGWQEILLLELFVLVLFFCVILHEFGHALMAKRLGISTRDIILSPIGGIARLERLPKLPNKEILIAFAGPMVNIIIALLAFIILFFLGYKFDFPVRLDLEDLGQPQVFLKEIMIINVYLFIFNLIPAFPMDGGRILRALIALKWDRVLATRIATIIGIILAGAFIVYGIMINNYILVLIGFFVSFMAGSENRNVKYETFLERTTLKEVAYRDYPVIYLTDPVSTVIPLFKQYGFDTLPVFSEAGTLIGVTYRPYFDQYPGLDHSQEIQRFLLPSFKVIEANIILKDLTEIMNSKGYLLVAFMESDGKYAIIDRKRLQLKLDLSSASI